MLTSGTCGPQAFYLPTDADLIQWAAAHPEYTPQAIAALAASVADFRGLLRAKRQALIDTVVAAAAAAAII